MSKFTVGLFGLGVIAQGMVTVLRNNDKHKFMFYVFCRDPKKDRKIDLHYPSGDIKFVSSVDEIFQNKDVDVIVELMGGADGLALEVITRALSSGFPVVTANKALIAKHLPKLEHLISVYNGRMWFEGSVCGGMPLIATLQNFHISNCDPITHIEGIVNGSTNYLLWSLEDDASLDFVSMIVDLTSKGYLEADPSQDIEGHDARAKLVILTRLAFGVYLDEEDNDGVACIGVPDLHSRDRQYIASTYNATVRLIARVKESKPNEVCAIVMPMIVDKASQFGMINKNYNCVKVTSQFMGEMIMIGEGAGGSATGQAVAHDVLKAVTSKADQTPVIFPPLNKNKLIKTWSFKAKFLLRIETDHIDRLLSMQQVTTHKRHDMGDVSYIEFTATYGDVRALVQGLKSDTIEFALLRFFDDPQVAE